MWTLTCQICPFSTGQYCLVFPSSNWRSKFRHISMRILGTFFQQLCQGSQKPSYLNFWCLFQGYNIKASCNLMMRNHSVWSVCSAPKEVQQLPNMKRVGFQVAANAEDTLDIRIEVDKIRTMLSPLLSSCRMSWWADSVFKNLQIWLYNLNFRGSM